MKKNTSQKILPWTTADVVWNVVTYVANIALITVLFFAAAFLTRLGFGQNINETFSNPTTFVHFIILLTLTVAIMAFYFAFEEKDFLKNPANSEMLFLILELALIVCFMSGRYINIYLRPLSLAALMTLFLTDRRTAIFMNVIFCIMIFLFDSFIGSSAFSLTNYPVLIMGFSSGIIATVCMDKVYSRMKLLLMSALISVPTLVCILMTIIEHGGDVVKSLVFGAFSGPLAVAAFMVLLPVFETSFKRVSCFKYSELTDHKSKLIKKLIHQAPGTFNHSIVVSNIAEACATAIGEDAMLARACAYYHDIGKLRRPEFFSENQADKVNPHDDVTPELSANIIKSHATDGYQLVMKSRLPQEIAEVCVQHHGTLPILYFYDKAKKFTDGEVDLAQYCYPGPKPQTKIAAILMIADGCEAAVRTLQDRSRENVKKLVRKIVNDRMELGQFEDCEITLKEINIIIHTVVNNLTGVYHNRVEYPKVNLDGMEL